MKKPIANHFLSSNAHVHDELQLDDDGSGSFGLSASHFSFDGPKPFGALHGSKPALVLYSSDIGSSSVRAPEVFMAAGSSSGSTNGGATSSGSTLVQSASGTGLTINVGWDSSV